MRIVVKLKKQAVKYVNGLSRGYNIRISESREILVDPHGARSLLGASVRALAKKLGRAESDTY